MAVWTKTRGELVDGEVPNVLNQEGDESIVDVQFIDKKEIIKMLENGQLVDSILLASLAMWLSRNWSGKI